MSHERVNILFPCRHHPWNTSHMSSKIEQYSTFIMVVFTKIKIHWLFTNVLCVEIINEMLLSFAKN